MNIPMTDICRLIGLQLGMKQVNETDHLRNDLGAESLDIQNIVSALEDRYHIHLPDDALEEIATVTDFHTLVMAQL